MPAPSLKLPFNVIKPGAFNGAFPGVETQAMRNKPVAPMINTVASDRAAALGRSGAPVPAAPSLPAPASTMPDTSASDTMVALGRGMPPGSGPTAAKAAEMWGTPAPAAAQPPSSSAMGTPFGPPNALSRGAPAGAASSLGGPVPVGRSRFDPQRMAEMMVRRKNPMGAQFLFGQARDQVGHEQAKELFGMNQSAANARDQVGHEQAKELFGMNQSAMNARDQVGHEQAKELFGMNQSAADERYTRGREDEITDEQRRAAAARETYPIFDPITGQPNMGTFMTGNGQQVSRQKPEEPGMTADDIAAARAMGGDVNIQQGNTQVRLPGQRSGKADFTLKEIAGTPVPDPLTGRMMPGPSQMVRIFDDGTYEPIQPRGESKAAPTKTDDPKTKLAALRAKAGLK